MVQRKERTLLVDVQSLDAEPSPPAAAALFAELRAALERAGGDASKVATRNYSREARICAVRTPLALSRMARTAIGTVKYVKGRCACCCGMHCERARAAFFLLTIFVFGFLFATAEQRGAIESDARLWQRAARACGLY